MTAVAAPEYRPVTRAERRNSIIAGTIGNFVEWFDWSIYGFFAPIFATEFFPKADKTAALLSALAVFAVGFLFRPIGALFFGPYGDRKGRKAGMTLTIVLMACASLAAALVPNYAAIGIAAPAIFVLARCVQGFSAGGEFGTSSAYMVEHAEPRQRATVGSWQQVSVGGGTLLASILMLVMLNTMAPGPLHAYGWRIAFGLGAVLGLIGLWLRLRAAETEPFGQLQARRAVSTSPMLDVVRAYPRQVVRVIAMVAAGTALTQFWFVYAPTMMSVRAHTAVVAGGQLQPSKPAQMGALIGLAVFTVLQPLSGRLSDRIGRKPMLLFYALGSAIAFVPLILMVKPGIGPVGYILPPVIAGVFLAAYAGSLAAVMAEQFPPEVRTAGISLPYGLAVAIFGGFTPVLSEKLLAAGRYPLFMGIVVVLCLASAVVFARMRETVHDEI